ncbi:hypothetical protein RSAG8_10581, partial [Rhizoctonia solani AG-8 WAC10335]
MPTTRLQAKRARQSEVNQRPLVGINRLPSEVLSEIFLICDRTRGPLDGKWNPFECQIVFPSICRYWRKVALGTIALWTSVTLLDRPPWHFSKLCLLRSGSSALLDINLGMEGKSWAETGDDTWEECAQRTRDAFDFIVEHGGVPSRWRTFTTVTDILSAQLVVIGFLGKAHFPSLTSLDTTLNVPDLYGYANGFTLGELVQSSPRILFQGPLPRLRSVKLECVPNSYLFGHRLHPQLVGLSHLEIRFEGLYPSLADFNKMLVANPNLETLTVNTEMIIGPVGVDRGLPKPQLPMLQSLSFVKVASSFWTLHAIAMLDVPNLISLELTLSLSPYLGGEEGGIRKLLDHIIGDQSQATPEARFPSLRSLTLASAMQPGLEHDIAAVLAAYPQLTSLTLPTCPSLSPLLKRPWLAPGIERLWVGVKDLVQLENVVHSRCKAGLPLRTVLVDNLELREKVKPNDRARLRKYVDFALVLGDGERMDDD